MVTPAVKVLPVMVGLVPEKTATSVTVELLVKLAVAPLRVTSASSFSVLLFNVTEVPLRLIVSLNVLVLMSAESPAPLTVSAKDAPVIVESSPVMVAVPSNTQLVNVFPVPVIVMLVVILK